MKLSILLALPFLFAVASARPVNAKFHRREVPQEHSHEQFLRTVNIFLRINNPDNIVDAVFGLLGNAAASQGQGNVPDTDCLQQATADRAFTNAKQANDIDGMTAALVYRALERNTGAVGLASVPCTAIKAVNPEIAALSQHQDPASPNAAKINKDITLELARQIASIGGDPIVALKSGTFAPGQIGDPTAAGNTCDDPNDPIGCIITLNLLVEDASVQEINAAVAGTSTTATSQAVDCGATAPSAATPATTAAAAGGATGSSSNLDLGSCSNPTIVFGPGFDGRNEDSFEPADTATFTHGSALNIKVIIDFICQQLDVKCEASQAAIDACNQGATAAQAVSGQAAADTFNTALGF